MVGSLLVYGGLGAIVIAFISFRVVHLHTQYKVLEALLADSRGRSEASLQEAAQAKKLLALVQENTDRLGKEHEQALAAVVEQRNSLQDKLKKLKAHTTMYARQLRLAQQERMPKHQLVICKALLTDKGKKLLNRAREAVA